MAHEHLAWVLCIEEAAFCYATNHPKYPPDLRLGQRDTAFTTLLHNPASTFGDTCASMSAFSVSCLPDFWRHRSAARHLDV